MKFCCKSLGIDFYVKKVYSDGEVALVLNNQAHNFLTEINNE